MSIFDTATKRKKAAVVLFLLSMVLLVLGVLSFYLEEIFFGILGIVAGIILCFGNITTYAMNRSLEIKKKQDD